MQLKVFCPRYVSGVRFVSTAINTRCMLRKISAQISCAFSLRTLNLLVSEIGFLGR